MWVGNSWFKQGSLVKRIIEEDPTRKIPLEKLRLNGKDCAKKDIKGVQRRKFNGGIVLQRTGTSTRFLFSSMVLKWPKSKNKKL